MRLEGLLRRAALLHRGDPAITDAHRQVTFGALEAEAAAMAGALADLGVGCGDRVAVVARNGIAYAALYFAAGRLGAVVVPVNWRLGADETAYILEDSRARVVVADPEFAPIVDRAADRVGDLHHRVLLAGGTGDDGWLPPTALAGRSVEGLDGPTDDVVVQMYTSGTTGNPKGVLLTHRNLATLATAWLTEMPLEPGRDRFLQVTPLFHVGGLLMLQSTVARGAEILLQPDFAAPAALEAVAERGVTAALFVPTMLRFLLDEAGVADRAYPDLRLVAYGASAISPALLTDAIRVFDCDFVQGYGLTETAGVLTALRPRDHREALAGDRPERLASAGRVVSCSEVRIVDPDGRPVGPGETGELVARGDNVTPGYWGRPDETADALRNGWFHTGDVARMDTDGYVTIVDRIKDMIVSGGENISPREVEIVLEDHPSVREAAVIGVPHDAWGERVHAVVQAANGATVDDAAVLAHCRERLARFKCPGGITVVDELPHNAAGKLLKHQLRERWWAGRDRRV